jgi:DNA polymerase-3 subunit alpha
MGIQVLPPDVNESLENFSVPKNSEPKIRFGLTAIKNVGLNICKAIIDERKAGGPFENIDVFVRRVKHKDLNKKSMESMIKAGAMDQFGERAVLLASMDQLLEYARENQKSAAAGQFSLFDSQSVSGDASMISIKLQEAQPASRSVKLMWEKELLGLFISDHPLKDYENKFKAEKNLKKIKELVEMRNNTPVKIGGLVTNVHKIMTKNGEPMVFTMIEDGTARVEVVVFPSIFKQNQEAFQENRILVVSGKVSDKDGIPKVLCEDVKTIATLS